MSSLIAISIGHNTARLLATRDFADTGAGNSYFELFDDVRPAPGSAASVAPVVKIVLDDPCGTIVSDKLRVTQKDATGDLILRNSTAPGVQWGRWYRADGVPMGDFDVSDDAGDGFVKIIGAAGTTLYAGGRAIMGLCELQ